MKDRLPRNRTLKEYSRILRSSMTDAEILLWSRIRRKSMAGCQFYRQKIIGNYIVDFYCHRARLVIEVDGGQHYTSEGKQKDMVRDDYMAQLGLTVLRFSDREILENLDGVVDTIWRYLPSEESPFGKGGLQVLLLWERGTSEYCSFGKRESAISFALLRRLYRRWTNP